MRSSRGVTGKPILPKEERQEALKAVQDFFLNERDESIGIVAATDILEFFLDDLGVRIYNQALDDAKKWYERQAENLEIDYTLLYKNK